MTEKNIRSDLPERIRHHARRCVLAALAALLSLTTGCTSFGTYFKTPWEKADAKKLDGPKENISLTGAGLTREPMDPGAKQEIEAAKRLIDEKKYAEAETAFHKLVSTNTEASWWQVGLLAPDSTNKTDATIKKGSGVRGRGVNPVLEAALFYEAESQRLQKSYRSSADSYTRLLAEFPRSQYTPGACKGLFEIADYWLEPTRKQMDEYQDQLAGKRWFVTPAMYIHFSKDMPALDAEGHAVAVLNTIRNHDIKGELGRKALLYLGTIHFYRQDYKEADFYFTRLYEEYPNDKDAAKAIKQSVICKQLVTGGSVYDMRGVEESKKLLMTAMGAYPELAKDDGWVRGQLASINTQQADRDYKIAEFYERTGHPGSAYFYYELVCRRYPNSELADKAAKRKGELKGKADKEQKLDGGPPPGDPAPAVPQLQAPTNSPIQVPPRALPPGFQK